MNQLLPIIRRVRRPLVVADRPPVMVGSVEVPAALAQVGADAQTTDHGPQTTGPVELVNEVSGESVAAPLADVPPIKSHAKGASNRRKSR